MSASNQSEIYLWLKTISNGLSLERLSTEFESRGFKTVSSLKYLKESDLDVLFPSPQKLSLAEKRILEEEVQSLKRQRLPGRELFPKTSEQRPQDPPFQVFHTNTSLSCSPAIHAPNIVNNFLNDIPSSSASSTNKSDQKSTTTYLDKRDNELKEDGQLLQAQINSVSQLLTKKAEAFERYGEGRNARQKLCTKCHLPGHTKVKCSNGECKGVVFCNMRDKHPELKSEIVELKRMQKDLEKKQEKAKAEYDTFKAARERAANSFFSIMRPRLRSQNPMRYIDRQALDKDLLILKKALGNKIPIDERQDWELPYVIERFKRSNVDIYAP